MERKGILKSAKRLGLLKVENSSVTTHSSSIGAVRWAQHEEIEQPYSSAPSRPVHSLAPLTRQQPHQNGLKDLRSLQECVQFIQHWKEQVDQVCRGDGDTQEVLWRKETRKSSGRSGRSLEESRKLILEWAEELHHVDKPLKENAWPCESSQDGEGDGDEEAQLRIMEWAKELLTATESCGVQSDKLGKVVHLLSHRRKLLVRLLPLLEFITWSLLKEDSTREIPRLWLLAKQRTWKAGIPRYIPNSVWSWICSAAADVILDPVTSNPWLLISDDQRRVQEGPWESDPPYSSQRFDTWPCVLGWEGYNHGRRYWEVDITHSGYWRVGLTTVDSRRHGHCPMTPKQGYWVLWRSPNHFYACSKPETELPLGLVPRRLGVYLDYQEGQVSFYNAETKSHIYTFTGAFRGKLYPLFAPLDGRTVISIIEPRKTSAS